jgi:hypothetical protein
MLKSPRSSVLSVISPRAIPLPETNQDLDGFPSGLRGNGTDIACIRFKLAVGNKSSEIREAALKIKFPFYQNIRN